MSEIFGNLPPMVTALAALAFVGIWQIAGTALLAPPLRRSGLGRGMSLLLAWLLWLPVCGTAGIVMALCEQAFPDRLLAVMGVVLLAAVASAWPRRHQIAALFAARPQGFSPSLIWAGAAVGLLKVSELLYAAHPQRLYDQLNYHLVLAKRVLTVGHPFAAGPDPHLLIAGPTEYAYLWPGALGGGDLLQLGIAQSWIYLASVVPIAAAGWLVARRRGTTAAMWAALALAFAVPGLLPNGEIARIAKPGALLLAGTVVTLLAATENRRQFRALAATFSLLYAAVNPTYIHAAVAFGLVISVGWLEAGRPRFRLAVPLPLLLIAGTGLIVELTRSFVMTGTFFYPSDARFLPTPYSDAMTLGYWKWVAFGSNERFFEHFAGAWRVPARSPGLLICAASAIAVIGYLRRRRPAGEGALPPALQTCGLFLAAFALVWPAFYDSHIFSRFVAAYLGGLLTLIFLTSIYAPPRIGIALAALGLVAAVSTSGTDVIVRRLITWNQGSLVDEYAVQFPRFLSAQAVNRLTTAGDRVLADEPEKLHFTGSVLTGGISPKEREAWDALMADPQGAAAEQRVTAVVIDGAKRGVRERPLPFTGPINELFEKLAPYGTIEAIGDDLVLVSTCHFKSLPCPVVPARVVGTN